MRRVQANCRGFQRPHINQTVREERKKRRERERNAIKLFPSCLPARSDLYLSWPGPQKHIFSRGWVYLTLCPSQPPLRQDVSQKVIVFFPSLSLSLDERPSVRTQPLAIHVRTCEVYIATRYISVLDIRSNRMSLALLHKYLYNKDFLTVLEIRTN